MRVTRPDVMHAAMSGQQFTAPDDPTRQRSDFQRALPPMRIPGPYDVTRTLDTPRARLQLAMAANAHRSTPSVYYDGQAAIYRAATYRSGPLPATTQPIRPSSQSPYRRIYGSLEAHPSIAAAGSLGGLQRVIQRILGR